MKKLLKLLTLPLIGVSVLASSCFIFQGKEKRAQNHLAKAISLDPSIMRSKDSVVLKDSVRYHDTTIVHTKDSVNVRTKDSTIIIPKSDLNGVIGNPCDSIKGLQKFDYSLGSGVHKLHIWSDGMYIRYSSTVDSLVSIIQSKDTYVLHLQDSLTSKESEIKQLSSVHTKDVVTVIKYKASIWQILLYIAIGAGGMFVLHKFGVIK